MRREVGDGFPLDVEKISRGRGELFGKFDVQMREGSEDNEGGGSGGIKPLRIVFFSIEVAAKLVEKGAIGTGHLITILSQGVAILISREDSDGEE